MGQSKEKKLTKDQTILGKKVFLVINKKKSNLPNAQSMIFLKLIFTPTHRDNAFTFDSKNQGKEGLKKFLKMPSCFSFCRYYTKEEEYSYNSVLYKSVRVFNTYNK